MRCLLGEAILSTVVDFLLQKAEKLFRSFRSKFWCCRILCCERGSSKWLDNANTVVVKYVRG